MKKLLLLMLFNVLLATCSIPKIIVYEDPLTAEEHNNLGVTYLKQGKFELAEREFIKAIKKSPEWSIPYFNMGNLFYILKKYDKAENYYRKAIKVSPHNTDAINNLAYLLYKQKRFDEALTLIETAIKLKEKPEYLDTYEKIKKSLQNN